MDASGRDTKHERDECSQGIDFHDVDGDWVVDAFGFASWIL
jgi:hypothetical protein